MPTPAKPSTGDANPKPEKPSRDPVPVVVVQDLDDNNNPPLRMYAVLIFIGTLLGSLLGAVADLGEAVDTFSRLGDVFNPPPQICVSGSDTILGESIGLAGAWSEDFESRYRAYVSNDATGSNAGVTRAIEGGCVDVLAMSEKMDERQYAALTNAGIEISCAAEVGYDVIAFVTDINNRVVTLAQRQLNAILNGRINNWRDVGGDDRFIKILARPIDRSGTTKHVMLKVASYQEDFFPIGANYFACEDNEACLNETLATPGAIYWVSVAWMRTQPEEYLRVMPILKGDERPINPLHDDFTLDDYPSALARPLYMYVLKKPNTTTEQYQAAVEYLKYVRSLRGQQLLEERGFSTYFDRSIEIPVELPPGFEAAPSELAPLCKPS